MRNILEHLISFDLLETLIAARRRGTLSLKRNMSLPTGDYSNEWFTCRHSEFSTWLPELLTMVQAREQYGHRLQRLVLTGMRCICVEESDVDTLRGFVGELLDDRI